MTQTQINHPDYYQLCVAETRHIALMMIRAPELLDVECIEVIERLGLGFHESSALKYLWRAGDKGEFVSDLLKARWYLHRLSGLTHALHKEFIQHVIEAIDQLLTQYRDGSSQP